jgi:hypothetical protein
MGDGRALNARPISRTWRLRCRGRLSMPPEAPGLSPGLPTQPEKVPRRNGPHNDGEESGGMSTAVT